MTDEWVKNVNLDVFDCEKRMMIAWKQLCQKATGEYETAGLRTPYRIIALMLNRIFGWEMRILQDELDLVDIPCGYAGHYF